MMPARDPQAAAARLLALGTMAEERADYPRAEGVYREAVRLTGKAGSELHTRSLAGLARIHRVRGRYARAERLYQRALALAEERWGRQGLEVAGLLNELAIVHKYAGRFAEAGRLYRRALRIL